MGPPRKVLRPDSGYRRLFSVIWSGRKRNQAASLRVPLRHAVDKVRRGPGVCPKRPHCEEVAAVVARRNGGVRGTEVARAYLHRGPTSTACAGGEMYAGQAQVAADTFAQGFGPRFRRRVLCRWA